MCRSSAQGGRRCSGSSKVRGGITSVGDMNITERPGNYARVEVENPDGSRTTYTAGRSINITHEDGTQETHTASPNTTQLPIHGQDRRSLEDRIWKLDERIKEMRADAAIPTEDIHRAAQQRDMLQHRLGGMGH